MPPPLFVATFAMMVLLDIVGEEELQYIPAPLLVALPLRIVKPSMTVVPVAPDGEVTTVPPWFPSSIVAFAIQFR